MPLQCAGSSLSKTVPLCRAFSSDILAVVSRVWSFMQMFCGVRCSIYTSSNDGTSSVCLMKSVIEADYDADLISRPAYRGHGVEVLA